MTVGHYSLCSESIERETGFEPATSSLARKCSTTEPLPHSDFYESRNTKQWAMRDSNSHGSSPTDPKSVLSTNFSNRPYFLLSWDNISLVDNTSVTYSMSRQLSCIATFWLLNSRSYRASPTGELFTVGNVLSLYRVLCNETRGG